MLHQSSETTRGTAANSDLSTSDNARHFLKQGDLHDSKYLHTATCMDCTLY